MFCTWTTLDIYVFEAISEYEEDAYVRCLRQIGASAVAIFTLGAIYITAVPWEGQRRSMRQENRTSTCRAMSIPENALVEVSEQRESASAVDQAASWRARTVLGVGTWISGWTRWALLAGCSVGSSWTRWALKEHFENGGAGWTRELKDLPVVQVDQGRRRQWLDFQVGLSGRVVLKHDDF